MSVSWWDALKTTVAHPIGTIGAIIAPDDPRGMPTTAGGALAATLADISGSVSSEQELRIRLAATESDARAQGPKVYGEFLKLKADLEAIWKRNNPGDADPVTGAVAPGSNESAGNAPDLTNSPWKVLILLGALLVAFGMLRD